MACPYPRKSNPKLSDLALLWDDENSGYAGTALNNILELFNQSATSSVKEATTQYAAPAATAFNIIIREDNEDTWLVLSPAAILAAGAITLPAPGLLRDKQIITVNCTQQVTALTVDGNGATAVYGAPTSLGADDFFVLKYDLLMTSWYRIG